MTKLLVCGSRSITDAEWVSNQISALVAEKGFSLSDLILIEGSAKGVDAMGKDWAVANGVPVETHKADWARYGRVAATGVMPKWLLLPIMFLSCGMVFQGVQKMISICVRKIIKTTSLS